MATPRATQAQLDSNAPVGDIGTGAPSPSMFGANMLSPLLNVASATADYFSNRSYLKRRKRQIQGMDFVKTPYGQALAKTAAEGSISPGQRAAMMTTIGAETGAATAEGKAGLAARSRRRLGVSFASDANQFDIARMQQMGGAAQNIDMENQRTKTAAGMELAQQTTAYQQARREAWDEYNRQKAQNNTQFATKIFGTAGALATNAFGQKKAAADKAAWAGAVPAQYAGLDPDVAMKAAQIEAMVSKSKGTGRSSPGSGLTDENDGYDDMLLELEKTQDLNERQNIFDSWLQSKNQKEHDYRSTRAKTYRRPVSHPGVN